MSYYKGRVATYSKPTSPGRLPSKSLGRATKGMAFDMSLLSSAICNEVTDRDKVLEDGANAAEAPITLRLTIYFIAEILFTY